jgi:multicomponent Na+:H+ antiporter subunit F
MIFIAIAGLLVVCAAAALARMLAGPTLYDRALAASAVVGKAALLCAVLAAGFGRSEWADVALGLTAASFAASAASMKFFRFRTFQQPVWRDEAGAQGDAP